ncbi:hypothetical protein OROHE_007824 [Orobanche hederae]
MVYQKSKDHSPNVIRFFKIMFGKDFGKFLYLPPLFARKMKHLVGQEAQIEDSSGLRWPVMLSCINGSLAFHKGWSKFYVDHGLKGGQFLVFNYINGTHFTVRVFGETACETTDFDNVRPRRSKRLKTNMDWISPDEPFQTTDINSREKPSPADLVASRSEFRNCGPIFTNLEDPCCMIDRRGDECCYRGERRDVLYDLSCFEMEKKKPDTNALSPLRNNSKADDSRMAANVIHTDEINGLSEDLDKFEESQGTEKVSSHADNTKTDASHTVKKRQAVMDVIHTSEIFVDKFEKASGNNITPFHAVKRDQTRKTSDNSRKINGDSNDILTDKFRIKFPDCSNASKKLRVDVSDSQNGDSRLRASDRESPSIGRNKAAEKEENVVKHSCPESSVSKKRPIIAEHGQMLSPVVKVEPDLSCDTVAAGGVSPFSAEVESQSYLELPVHIPSAPGRREGGRGKVVYLRDPTGKLWPMLYPDLISVKALTGNWKRFCKQNGIKPGDECRFQVENEKMYYYRVDITHKHRGGEFSK